MTFRIENARRIDPVDSIIAVTVPEPTQHSGVYGVWTQDGKLVTVRKARGPYTGLLDLPGGSPEPGESPEQTLRRELV